MAYDQRAIEAINRVSVPEGGGYIPPGFAVDTEVNRATFGTIVRDPMSRYGNGFSDNCSVEFDKTMSSGGTEFNGRTWFNMPKVGILNPKEENVFFSFCAKA